MHEGGDDVNWFFTVGSFLLGIGIMLGLYFLYRWFVNLSYKYNLKTQLAREKSAKMLEARMKIKVDRKIKRKSESFERKDKKRYDRQDKRRKERETRQAARNSKRKAKWLTKRADRKLNRQNKRSDKAARKSKKE